jgi:hypothetical protein
MKSIFTLRVGVAISYKIPHPVFSVEVTDDCFQDYKFNYPTIRGEDFNCSLCCIRLPFILLARSARRLDLVADFHDSVFRGTLSGCPSFQHRVLHISSSPRLSPSATLVSSTAYVCWRCRRNNILWDFRLLVLRLHACIANTLNFVADFLMKWLLLLSR